MKIANMIQAIDLHACGEPGRVIVGGVLDVPGTSMFEKMRHFETKADHLRKRMLREPRGYPAANCNLILPPTRPEADAGYIIMEQVEYPPMSGTNTICVTTALIETGMVAVTEPITRLTLESPAGLIGIEAEVRDGKVKRVTFENVPAFAVHLDRDHRGAGDRPGEVDVAWGGMFYVIVDAAQLGLEISAGTGRRDRAPGRDGEGRGARAASGRPSRKPRHQGHHHRANLRARRPTRAAQRKNAVVVSTGEARLAASFDLDRGHRPFALRYRHLRQDGLPACQGRTGAEPGISTTRASWARSSPAACCAKPRSAPTARSCRS